MVVFPGRMIESDVILVASPQRRVVGRNITWEESDHHAFNIPGMMHKRKFPRRDEENEAEAENGKRDKRTKHVSPPPGTC